MALFHACNHVPLNQLKSEAHKAKEAKEEEQELHEEGGGDEVEAGQPHDLEAFANVWRCVLRLVSLEE